MTEVSHKIFPLPHVAHPPGAEQSVGVFLRTAMQLFMLLTVVHFFNFEHDSYLTKILPILFIGYLVHESLPLRYRLPFFFFLGLFSIFFVTGPITGSIIVAAGLLLIGLAHSPFPRALKIILAFLVLIAFALVQFNIFRAPLLYSAIPFIASMFMFRYILYLYELRFEKQKISLWHRLSYFFLLPNISAPLFPIIDYKTFSHNYYSIHYKELQEKSIRKIFRGVLHLIAYRFIYFNLIPSPVDIIDLVTLVQYVVLNYLMILRLSGLFHFILGVIGLFGFDLPEIFNNYFLASSFSDLWRRINVYWREFVIKIFFQPIFFKLKKSLGRHALIITVLIVFFFNWLLHNYQWFWLHGDLILKKNDVLFWAIFGVVVALNSVYQRNKQEKGVAVADDSRSIKTSIFKVLRILGIFFFMASLWFLWCSTSLPEFVYLVSFARIYTVHQLLGLAGVLLFILILGVLLDRYLSTKKNQLTKPASSVIIFSSFVLFVLSIPQVGHFLFIDPRNFIAQLEDSRLNNYDKLVVERGYYQKLLSNDGQASRELWKSHTGKEKAWTEGNEATTKTNDLLGAELAANAHVEFKGAFFSTNSWGMRDKEYPLKKEEGTWRIVLIGGSYEMGSGVPDGKNFESIVEAQLNDPSFEKKHTKIEILDLAVGGYYVFQNLKVCDKRAFSFGPDMLLYVAHSQEFYRAARKLSSLIIHHTDLEYPFLYDVVRLAGVKDNMCQIEIEKRLKYFMPVIIQWAYLHIGRLCREHKTEAVWLYLPVIDETMAEAEWQTIEKMAAKAGFFTLSLKDVYKNHNLDSIKLSTWDNHPNVRGHQLIAKQLFEKIKENKIKLNL